MTTEKKMNENNPFYELPIPLPTGQTSGQSKSVDEFLDPVPFYSLCENGSLGSIKIFLNKIEQLEKTKGLSGLRLGVLLRPDKAGLLPIHHAILGKQDVHILLTLSAWMGEARDKVVLPKEWKVSDTTALTKALEYSVSQKDISNIYFFIHLGADAFVSIPDMGKLKLKNTNASLCKIIDSASFSEVKQTFCDPEHGYETPFVKKLVEEMQPFLEEFEQRTAPKGNGSSFKSAFFKEKARQKMLSNKPSVVGDTQEVEKLLNYGVEGEQEKAEALIKEKPELLLASGKVTDPAGRTFEKTTAFQ